VDECKDGQILGNEEGEDEGRTDEDDDGIIEGENDK